MSVYDREILGNILAQFVGKIPEFCEGDIYLYKANIKYIVKAWNNFCVMNDFVVYFWNGLGLIKANVNKQRKK